MSAAAQLKSKIENPLKKTEGIETKRNLRKFQADKTSYTSDNKQDIVIDISSPMELLDFQNGYLLYDIVATGTPTGGSTGTLIYNDWAGSSWIRQLKVQTKSGSQIGKEVNYYNALVRLEYEMKMSDDVASSYLNTTEGARFFTDAVDATVSVQFAHRFISHIFTSEDYFPVFAFDTLQIVLTMEDAVAVVRAGGDRTAITSPEYTISNLSYSVDVIEVNEASFEELQNLLKSGGIDVDYTRVNGQRTTKFIDTELFRIGVIDGAIKNVRMTTVLDTDRDAVIEDFYSRYDYNNLTSWRFFLNNKPLTAEAIQVSATRKAEALIEFMKSQRLNLDQLVYGSDQLVLDDRQVIASRFDRATNDDVISSIRDPKNNEITVNVQFSSAGAANTTYIFTNTDQRVRILSGGTHEDIALFPVAANLASSST